MPYNAYSKELEAVLDTKTVVVSIFGKSSYQVSSYKTEVLDKILGHQLFRSSVLDEPTVDKSVLSEIEGYYCAQQKIIYLHLRGVYDTHTLTGICQQLSSELEEKSFLSVWTHLKHKYAQALLFLFSVSHIMIYSHPSHVFDTSCIHLFKALDSIRLKIQGSVCEILGKICGINSEWASNGRMCSPRVLFLFQSCPPALQRQMNKQGESRLTIKKFEHALEDQIYYILRKRKVITHMSANSLFAIPANQEFVYVLSHKEPSQDWIPFLVNSLVELCKTPNLTAEQNHCNFGYESLPSSSDSGGPANSFQKFLQQHVDQAFVKGFDDNIGRNGPNVSNFVVPAVGVWVKASNALYSVLVGKSNQSGKIVEEIESLHSFLDTDVKFSEARCKKVFPIAVAKYQDSLPSHYTKQYHERKVAVALSMFGVHARGPLVDNYVIQLEQECEKYWKAGRQMCEVLSLRGNPCTQPLHKGGSGEPSIHEIDNSRTDLPVLEHSSGVRFVSACNCGRSQGTRDDPFTIKAANYDFYKVIGTECGCDRLDKIHFPIFQPSTKDFRAAQLFSNASLASSQKDGNSSIPQNKEHGTQQGNTQGLSLVYVSVQSGGGDSDIILGDGNLHHGNAITHHRASEMSLTEHNHHIIIQVSDADAEPGKDKSLVRQPSTTEYLPGMLHSESPASLLPQFPSWSLVCLGPSSLYSHNLGLQEQQQAGLVSGSSYLLPWDVTVRLEQQQKDKFWPTICDQSNMSRMKQNQPGGLSKGRKSKGNKDLSEFNVKIFVGVEYECPRGHRYMAAGPDKILKASGTGLVKDNGNKVTTCDMPLYFPCPCRTTKPFIGQLMRVHVVTPKAPVHVTLNPRVQPAPPPCPVFVPGCPEPVRLSQSAYWILRLPYVYAGDRGPYIAPKDPVPPMYGKLLAGMYGITEISDSK